MTKEGIIQTIFHDYRNKALSGYDGLKPQDAFLLNRLVKKLIAEIEKEFPDMFKLFEDHNALSYGNIRLLKNRILGTLIGDIE